MTIINDLELPIEAFVVNGPGVDAIANRKEENGRPLLTKKELEDNFGKVRENLLTGLRTLVSASGA